MNALDQIDALVAAKRKEIDCLVLARDMLAGKVTAIAVEADAPPPVRRTPPLRSAPADRTRPISPRAMLTSDICRDDS